MASVCRARGSPGRGLVGHLPGHRIELRSRSGDGRARLRLEALLHPSRQDASFPPYPDPKPPSHPLKWLFIAASLVTAFGVEVALYYGLAAIGLYPGVWVFFTLAFLIPLAGLYNKYGRQRKGASLANSTTQRA